MKRGQSNKARVRVFIDYWNFANDWNCLTGAYPDRNLDWSAFPHAILDALDEKITQIRHKPKELRAVKIYTSSPPIDLAHQVGWDAEQRLREEIRLRDWMQNDLDQLTGFTVDMTPKADSPLLCEVCGCQSSQFVEQGVDTKIAIDLVSLASSDLYDIAVLASDDSDLVPSTQCVQDSLDKQVIHLGFERDRQGNIRRSEVRNEAWGHIFIDQMLSDILKR